jgi:hypothetical protein
MSAPKAIAWTDDKGPRIQVGERAASTDGEWDVLTVVGGWIYSRRSCAVDMNEWIVVSTTFVPFPSSLQR